MDETDHSPLLIGRRVRVGEAAKNLSDDVDSERDKQWSVVTDAPKVGAIDELHDEEEPTFGVTIEVEDLDEVRVMEEREQARLGPELRFELGTRRERLVDVLDRDGSAEALVRDRFGTMDGGHPTRT